MSDFDKKFREGRDRALEEIRDACIERINRLSGITSKRTPEEDRKQSMADYVRDEEGFNWPVAVLYIVADMKEEKGLKEAFSHVSVRYDLPDRRQVLGLMDDLQLSPEAKLDGRLNAFETILKSLDIAERDFSITYRPLRGDEVDDWRRRHPGDDSDIQAAHRAAHEKCMKEQISSIRDMLEGMKNPQSAPAAARVKHHGP
ncbi:MAG: hypothetical protein EPN97_08005 [Alphaproteobacteria bacterium]|nr:MAG: hypothetical protein EPN97_08005 [Alphaproteobacteria bacterium]